LKNEDGQSRRGEGKIFYIGIEERGKGNLLEKGRWVGGSSSNIVGGGNPLDVLQKGDWPAARKRLRTGEGGWDTLVSRKG